MLLRGIIATLLVAPLTSQAISMTAGDVQASEKIKYMQHVSGTDHSRMAAFVQADQTFTQWCGRSASVADLKRILHADIFPDRHEQCQAVPLKVPEVMPDAEQL